MWGSYRMVAKSDRFFFFKDQIYISRQMKAGVVGKLQNGTFALANGMMILLIQVVAKSDRFIQKLAFSPFISTHICTFALFPNRDLRLAIALHTSLQAKSINTYA